MLKRVQRGVPVGWIWAVRFYDLVGRILRAVGDFFNSCRAIVSATFDENRKNLRNGIRHVSVANFDTDWRRRTA